MKFSACSVLRALGMAFIIVATSESAFAQATSTFNGRVLDQGDAVLPGVTITAINTATGVTRTVVTNGDGSYYMPGLEPGVYDVKTELSGFAPTVREKVTLLVNSTITLDFKLALAGLNEAVTVTGEAPMIEVTQSKASRSIQATELQNLPMITRTVTGMLELLPGASAVAPLHRTKNNAGTVSYGGSSGEDVAPTVDGADNRDNHYGGPLMTFSTESLEQFQLTTSQFSAADGRTGGAAVQLVTKSGTNQLHGSAFGYERDRSLTSKDFFTAQSGQDKVPFSRQQYGGSIGGPIMKNKLFFFGAVERQQQDTGIPVPDALYNQIQILANAQAAGQIPNGLIYANHPHFEDTPGTLTMYSLKTNAQISNTQSMMGRFASQKDDSFNATATANNDSREFEDSLVDAYSAVVQHNWILGKTGLNQITGQVNHMKWLSDSQSRITGQHYIRDFPNVNVFPPQLSFPSVNAGDGNSGGSESNRYEQQIRDDFSLLVGTHALKIGGDFNRLPGLGLLNANQHFATITFFDDPSVIASNSNGKYPQGFQTPGIVRSWAQANGGAVNGVGSLANTVETAEQAMAWFQDDWRASSKMTLNLGIRYDVDLNLMDQEHFDTNAARQALAAIGSPFGGEPKTPTRDFSPRVGIAYDLSGDGKKVLRGGYGLYFDQYNTAAAAGDIDSLSRRPLNAVATLTNTAIGVGQLSTYRLGIDPFPPAPTQGSTLPANTTGQWISPSYVDPRTHQFHAGYAQTLAVNTVVSVDYTHSVGHDGLRPININPIVNGTRVLAPLFASALGNPNALSAINVYESINRSRYDALTFLFQRRFPRATLQAHYTLAGAYAFGGSTGNRSGASAPEDSNNPNAPGEWGPTGQDERHRVVVTGVFDLAWGIQLSPVFQAASARPYNLTAGTDLNADGSNNDRYIDPATGQQVSLNSARGDNTTLFDLRGTKFVPLGGERKLGLFVEAFNLLNTANFGGSYGGNARSATFQQPTGFIPSIGYPRQVQLGMRFLF